MMSKIAYLLLLVLLVTLGFGYFSLNSMLKKYSDDSEMLKCIYDTDKLIVDSSAAVKLAEKDLAVTYTYEKYKNLLDSLDLVSTKQNQMNSICREQFEIKNFPADIESFLSDSKSIQTVDSIKAYGESLQNERKVIFDQYDLLDKKYL